MRLAAGPIAEQDLLAPSSSGHDLGALWLLSGLERRGLLSRGVEDLFSLQPKRAPERPLPTVPSGDAPKLVPETLFRPAASGGLRVEVPGGWAFILVEHASVMPWLFELTGRESLASNASSAGEPPEDEPERAALLVLLSWAGCLVDDAQPPRGRWGAHGLMAHEGCRLGFDRRPLGKTKSTVVVTQPSPPDDPADPTIDLSLPSPFPDRSLESALERRRSVRRFADRPLEIAPLGELLFLTFAKRETGYSYPSGGSCYSLTPFLAVARCTGLRPGLYRYLHRSHGLHRLPCSAEQLSPLIDGASRSAGGDTEVQIVLVLSARFETVQAIYGDLSYSLILKEVGAVFQTIALVATALDIAACPLGTGDSLLFSRWIGTDPWVESSVGEILIGSLPEDQASGRRQ